MKILIVAATIAEAGFLAKQINKARPGRLITLTKKATFQVDVLITGVGITATVYHLTKVLNSIKYDLAINIGICGSLDPSIVPVRLVNITEDQFADFGAEDGKNVMDVFELGLAGKNEFPFKKGKLRSTYNKKTFCLKALPRVTGITVQLTHGDTISCRETYKKYGAVMETMEGAAFLYVCGCEKIRSLQLRAVSNVVEKRNKRKWKIKEALDALAGITGLLLLEMESSS